MPISLLNNNGWREVTHAKNWSSDPPRMLFFCPTPLSSQSDREMLRRVKNATSQRLPQLRAQGDKRTPTVVNSVMLDVRHGCLNKAETAQRWRRFAEKSSGCSSSRIAIPQSFVLPLECPAFLASVRARAVSWMIKPTSSYHGAGIVHLTRAQALEQTEALCGRRGLRNATIAQEYIEALPIEGGYKFDLRAYLLITARASPYSPSIAAYYHRGIARRSDTKYDARSSSTNVHVTNARSQHSKGASARSHFLSFARVGRALTDEHGFREDHMRRVVPAQMRALMRFVVKSLADIGRNCSKRGFGRTVSEGVGGFHLLAIDFAMDPTGNVWLLETNTSPLWMHYPTDDLLTPTLWSSALELALRVHANLGTTPSRHADWIRITLHTPLSAGRRIDYNACVDIPRRSNVTTSPAEDVAAAAVEGSHAKRGWASTTPGPERADPSTRSTSPASTERAKTTRATTSISSLLVRIFECARAWAWGGAAATRSDTDSCWTPAL
jgi:hypothetical protein